MLRLFGVLTLTGSLLLASFGGAADEPKGPPALNPEAAFKRGDTNGDGKLSKDEFRNLLGKGPRFKDNPQLIDRLFDRLDTNKDGFLTFDEFKKISELNGPGPRPGDKKPDDKKTPVTTTPDKPPTAEQLAFFEKKIRPVLVTHCYSCHSASAEKVRGEFLLDTREGIRKGGETGPAVVPGDVKKSYLIRLLRHPDDNLKMPKKERLPEEVIADFEKWIAMGAPDPREGATKIVKHEIDFEKGRQFWAFQAPKTTTPPAAKNPAWAKTDIDRYLLAGLEEKGLTPVADAERRTLIRRLYFDLIGLPPTPEELAEAEKLSVEQIVDKLLASPHFGERWARHWLDIARYAESSGRAANFSYPNAWRYRDYVIASFNADKPYDQFVREQIAGDLLSSRDDAQKAERLIATGFLALGPKVHNERNPRQFEMDLADEQIDVTFQAFMGLTVACARCHDHKFDPIGQRDYYALAGIFRSTETCYGTVRIIQNNHPSSLVSLPSGANQATALEPLTAAERTRIEKQITDAKAELAKIRGDFGNVNAIRYRTQVSIAESRLASYEADGTPKRQAMGARDRFRGQDSKLFIRGELDQPGDTIPRGFPRVLATKQPTLDKGSGRRELADWIASKDNPLTARVLANRVWLHLFGRGIVPTPDNFGASGQKPTNPALLDHLAVRLVDNGWSMKKLIREIVHSRVYQLSSVHDEKNLAIDPDNALVWRMSKRRLDAEPLHDAMLAISGRLDAKPAVGSSLARQGEGFAFGRGRFGGPPRQDDRHRTVYMAILRDNLPEELALFDFPDPSLVTGERATTTIPAQSLYLLNNGFVIRQAEGAADRLLAQNGTDEERFQSAYNLFFARRPSAKEVRAASDFLTRYTTATSTAGDRAKKAAWAALCQALFASAEFSNLN